MTAPNDHKSNAKALAKELRGLADYIEQNHAKLGIESCAMQASFGVATTRSQPNAPAEWERSYQTNEKALLIMLNCGIARALEILHNRGGIVMTPNEEENPA